MLRQKQTATVKIGALFQVEFFRETSSPLCSESKIYEQQ